MNEALIGFVGVIIGALTSWAQSWWLHKQDVNRNAQYLAIRVVNSLREYTYKCWLVAVDDGLYQGQPDSEGCLSPQAKDPGPIFYPDDIDWKSINPKLAYRLLSLPSKAESADRSISEAIEFCSGPPDYVEVFEERHMQYSLIGLEVISLEKELCKSFGLPQEKYLEEWNPAECFENSIKEVKEAQNKRAENQKQLMIKLGRTKEDI